MPTLLIVDDDVALTTALKNILTSAGYQILLTHTAEDGFNLALKARPDLILLDVMVPNMGGWELCRRLRAYSPIPIIFLTALSDVANVVHGLELGADDYIVKPFEEVEVLARIKAHLRRLISTSPPGKRMIFSGGDLIIDLTDRQVEVYERLVDLTPREYELLVTLAQNVGRVITTADLVHKAWGINDISASDNIKPYMHYLRKKIETDPTSPRWLKTVRGVGYRFMAD